MKGGVDGDEGDLGSTIVVGKPVERFEDSSSGGSEHSCWWKKTREIVSEEKVGRLSSRRAKNDRNEPVLTAASEQSIRKT